MSASEAGDGVAAQTDWLPAMTAACHAALDQSADARLLIGFSGGRDSTVLLHLIASLQPLRVTALHVDHGLHADSGRWRLHCEEFCRKLGVSLVWVRLHLAPGADLEARARRARYAAFAEHLGAGDVLLLAHHADDQAESLLLHLLQGRGAFGIPGQRRLGGSRVVRPFIDLPAAALTQYARVHRLHWIEDPSNEDLALDRNYLRHELMPRVEARFPNIGRRLGRVQSQLLATRSLLHDLLGLDRHPLPLELLEGREPAQRVVILRLWLLMMQRAGGVSDAALAAFADQLTAATDRQPELHQAGVRLRRYRNRLYLVDEAPMLADVYEIGLPGRVVLPHGEVRVEEVAEVAEETTTCIANPPLQIRFRGRTARGAQLEVRGHRRSVSELMRAASVPPWERDSYPLLFDESGLLAVPGVAMREHPRTMRAGAMQPAAPSGVQVRVFWQPNRGPADQSR